MLGTALDGAFLTDGKRLVQVISVGEADLVAEDVRFSCDEAADLVTIPVAKLEERWTLVRP